MEDEKSGKEQRQHPRTEDVFAVFYDLAVPMPVNMSTDTDEYPAVATDVSEGGIGLDVDRPLAMDTPVKLRFELYNSTTTTEPFRRRFFKLDGVIRHCEPRGKKYYRVGVEFAQTAPEERDFIAVYIQDLKLKQS